MQQNQTQYHTGVCEVHQYALNDTRPRMVFYCSLCDAYICEECNHNPLLRMKAAAIKARNRFFIHN